MIKSFEIVEMQNFYIIPELTLLKGDTLIIKFDQDIWDLDEASHMLTILKDNFPNNKIVAIFNGMELGVIHEI